MKRIVKQGLTLALGSAMLLPLLRRRLLRNCTTVLMYHELGSDDRDVEAWAVVRRSDFLRQLDYLRENYEIVSLDQAALDPAACGSGGKPKAVLTFDDGNEGNAEILLPIVQRERVPVAVFVATGHVQTGSSYWFDQLVNTLQHRRPVTLDLRDLGLGHYELNRGRGAQNWSQMQRLLSALKNLPPDRRRSVVDVVVARARCGDDHARGAILPLSLQGLRDLAASPWVTIGAHSHGHEVLTQLSVDDARASISQSRALLQQWTDRAIDHFAYPSGDYSEDVVALVERVGFRTAVATEHGLWRAESSRFLIPRIPVGRYDSIDAFKINLIGGVRGLATQLPV